jgi:hypothetical protein
MDACTYSFTLQFSRTELVLGALRKPLSHFFLSLRCFTYSALSNTAWNVGRSVSATEIPRIDSAIRFNQIVLQIFKNILIYAPLVLALNSEGGV